MDLVLNLIQDKNVYDFFRVHQDYKVLKETKVNKDFLVLKAYLGLREAWVNLDHRDLEDKKVIGAKWACQAFLE